MKYTDLVKDEIYRSDWDTSNNEHFYCILRYKEQSIDAHSKEVRGLNVVQLLPNKEEFNSLQEQHGKSNTFSIPTEEEKDWFLFCEAQKKYTSINLYRKMKFYVPKFNSAVCMTGCTTNDVLYLNLSNHLNYVDGDKDYAWSVVEDELHEFNTYQEAVDFTSLTHEFPKEGYCKSLDVRLIKYLKGLHSSAYTRNQEDFHTGVAWNFGSYWFIKDTSSKIKYYFRELEPFLLQQEEVKLEGIVNDEIAYEFNTWYYNELNGSLIYPTSEIEGYGFYTHSREFYTRDENNVPWALTGFVKATHEIVEQYLIDEANRRIGDNNFKCCLENESISTKENRTYHLYDSMHTLAAPETCYVFFKGKWATPINPEATVKVKPEVPEVELYPIGYWYKMNDYLVFKFCDYDNVGIDPFGNWVTSETVQYATSWVKATSAEVKDKITKFINKRYASGWFKTLHSEVPTKISDIDIITGADNSLHIIAGNDDEYIYSGEWAKTCDAPNKYDEVCWYKNNSTDQLIFRKGLPTTNYGTVYGQWGTHFGVLENEDWHKAEPFEIIRMLSTYATNKYKGKGFKSLKSGVKYEYTDELEHRIEEGVPSLYIDGTKRCIMYDGIWADFIELQPTPTHRNFMKGSDSDIDKLQMQPVQGMKDFADFMQSDLGDKNPCKEIPLDDRVSALSSAISTSMNRASKRPNTLISLETLDKLDWSLTKDRVEKVRAASLYPELSIDALTDALKGVYIQKSLGERLSNPDIEEDEEEEVEIPKLKKFNF